MTAFCFYCDGIFADGIFFYCDGIFADLVTAFCFPRWYAHVTAFFKNDFRDGILCDKDGIFLNVDGICFEDVDGKSNRIGIRIE